MTLLVVLLVWLLIFALCCWGVSLLPFPANPPWLRNVAYLIVCVAAILVLLNLVGWVDWWRPVYFDRHHR